MDSPSLQVKQEINRKQRWKPASRARTCRPLQQPLGRVGDGVGLGGFECYGLRGWSGVARLACAVTLVGDGPYSPPAAAHPALGKKGSDADGKNLACVRGLGGLRPLPAPRAPRHHGRTLKAIPVPLPLCVTPGSARPRRVLSQRRNQHRNIFFTSALKYCRTKTARAGRMSSKLTKTIMMIFYKEKEKKKSFIKIVFFGIGGILQPLRPHRPSEAIES